jgi:hypothetical protein
MSSSEVLMVAGMFLVTFGVRYPRPGVGEQS